MLESTPSFTISTGNALALLNVAFINTSGGYISCANGSAPANPADNFPDPFLKNNDSHLFRKDGVLWLIIVIENGPCLKTGNIIGQVIKQYKLVSASVFYPVTADGVFHIAAGVNDALFSYKNDNTFKELQFDTTADDAIKTIQNGITGSNLYRQLIETPANLLWPSKLRHVAREIQNKFPSANLNTWVVDQEDLKKEGYELLHAVGKSAPSFPGGLIFIEYKGDTDHPELDHLVVCKGVCFDTGGNNLKPGDSMAAMKMDMGGAALGLGLIYALAANKVKMNITVVLAAAYNMVSETAMRPGDVYTSKGISVEINNTDAEGRLVLMDGILYALNEKGLKPKQLTTLATLTGAGRVALGHFHTPICVNDPFVKHPATRTAYDPMFELPMTDAHLEVMKNSETAMLTNADTGGNGAGVSTAAAFIGYAVPKDLPWLHVDFSNVAKNANDISGNRKSAKQSTGRTFWPMYRILSQFSDGWAWSR